MTPAELAERNVGLVYAIAGDLWKRLGGEYDELVGDGMVGLMQAAMRFDPSRFDGPFSLYARRRVEGAIIDGYRRDNRTGYSHEAHAPRVRRESIDGWTTSPAHYLPRLDLYPNGKFQVETLVPTVPSAEDQCLARLDGDRITGQIAALPPKLRDAALAFASGRGRLVGLAESEGLTKSRVSQRVSEARRRLAA